MWSRLFGDPWERAFRKLREPKTTAELTLDEGAIRDALEGSPIPVREVEFNRDAWEEWKCRAEYGARHPDYYPDNLDEKSLEHYAAAQLLDLRASDVYIDVASQVGVAAEIYERLYDVESFRQDLDYPAGVEGRMIGGDAGAMPLPDGFADAMALHCSFEHFEGDSDGRFVEEAARVLKGGGSCIVAPLYLCHYYACLVDPVLAVKGGVVFEDDMMLHGSRSFGNRHGRFYDVNHLVERVWNRRGGLEMEVLVLGNREDFPASCYLRYILAMRKAR